MLAAVSYDVDSQAAVARNGFLLTAKLLALLERFEAAGIDVLPLKGPVLSQVLYGDPTVREYEDLDLLVRKKDVHHAAAVLLDAGYKPESAFSWLPMTKIMDLCCEMNFRRECGTVVDLHWELAPSDYPFRIDPEILWSSVETIRIAGRSVPTLSLECLMWFLSMHGAKHAWMRMSWVTDVARLIEIRPSMDWGRVLEMAGPHGGESVVLLAALLARDLFGARVPTDIDDRIGKNRIVAPLADQVKWRFGNSHPRSFGPLAFTKFNSKMALRRRDRIRHYAALLQAPTEAEARAFKLPLKLFWFYYPLRVLRLALKYRVPVLGSAPDSRPAL